eukprot:500177-Prymnesium_polylepis.2
MNDVFLAEIRVEPAIASEATTLCVPPDGRGIVDEADRGRNRLMSLEEALLLRSKISTMPTSSTRWRLMACPYVQRSANTSRSICNKHLLRGSTPSICSSTTRPLAICSIAGGMSAGGFRPRETRKTSTAQA